MVEDIGDALAEELAELTNIFAKGGKQNIKDTGLRDLSDQEIKDRLKDATGREKQRLKKEEKARKQRHSSCDK